MASHASRAMSDAPGDDGLLFGRLGIGYASESQVCSFALRCERSGVSGKTTTGAKARVLFAPNAALKRRSSTLPLIFPLPFAVHGFLPRFALSVVPVFLIQISQPQLT